MKRSPAIATRITVHVSPLTLQRGVRGVTGQPMEIVVHFPTSPVRFTFERTEQAAAELRGDTGADPSMRVPWRRRSVLKALGILRRNGLHELLIRRVVT